MRFKIGRQHVHKVEMVAVIEAATIEEAIEEYEHLREEGGLEESDNWECVSESNFSLVEDLDTGEISARA